MSTEKQRELWRKANEKYRKTEKGKAAAKRAEANRKDSRLNYRQAFLASFKGRSYILFNGARCRAKKRNLPFTLTLDWVRQHLEPLRCEVTGLDLKLIIAENYNIQNNMQPFSPCIDRIIPELGYTPENCRIVCCIFNTCKFHWTDEDVKTFVTAYYMKEIQN